MPDNKKKLVEITDGSLMEGEEVPTGNSGNVRLKEITSPDLIEGEEISASPKLPNIGYVGEMKASPTVAVNPLASGYVSPAASSGPRKIPFTEREVIAAPISREERQRRTDESIGVLATDYLDAMKTSSQRYPHPENVLFTDAESPVNQITNPAGDPIHTSRFALSRIGDLKSARQEMLRVGDIEGAKQTQEKISKIRASADGLIDLQLFNKEYGTKGHTDATASTAKLAAEQQYNAALEEYDKRIADTRKWEYPNGVPAEKERRKYEIAKEEARKDFESKLRHISGGTKYNHVLLGAEKAMLLGEKGAKEDYERIRAGKPISPQSQYRYQISGRDIVQTGLDYSVNENAKEEAEKYADRDASRLISDNKQYLVDEARMRIANRKYRSENPIINSVIPSSKITSKQIRQFGIEEEIDPEILEEVEKDPAAIPRSATLQSQVAKGALNFLAPTLYERGVRSIASLYGIGPEKVDEMFPPGWEQQRGIGAAIVGNMPSEQNSFHNLRGALGVMAETAGMLPVFGGIAKGVGKGIQALGAGEAAAERVANFGIMTLEGYNNAYHEAKDIVGDKPEDESLRQVYSMLSGVAQGALFSVHPPTKMVRGALGEMKKTGEELLDEIKSAGIKGAMKQEFIPAYAKYIKEIAKAEGVIIAQGDANLMAQNALKNMFASDKDKEVDVTEGLGDETLRTAISFLIPSIMGGIGTARAQTPLNKAAMFDVGSKPQVWEHYVEEGRNSGKFTNMEANQMLKGIRDMSTAIKQTPVQNESGAELTPDQIRDYSFSLMQEGVLQERMNRMQSDAELFKRPVDKAQETPIKEHIAALQKQRSEILRDAGEVLVVPPEEDNVNLEESEEKSIPLSSEIEDIPQSETTKTESDENATEGRLQEDGAQVSEATGSENGSEVRETASLQGREVLEDRQLSAEEAPEESVSGETAAAQPAESPEIVSEKPKRKRRKFNFEEEPEVQKEPIGVSVDERSVATGAESEETPANSQEKSVPNLGEGRIVIHRGLRVPEGKAREESGFYTTNRESSEGYAGIGTNQEGHVESRELNPDAKILKIIEGTEDEYRVNEAAASEFAKILGVDVFDGDITEVLWGNRQADKLLRDAGYDAVLATSMDGPVYYLLNPKATKKIKPESDASIQSKEQQQESIEPGGEPEHARVEQAGVEATQPEAEGGDSDIRSEGAQEEVQVEKPESSVAEIPPVSEKAKVGVPESEAQAPAEVDTSEDLSLKRAARLEEINEELVKQRASAKSQYAKLVAAEKASDIEAANKANDNWNKKKDRIAKLQDEAKSLEREQREEEIVASYNRLADRMEAQYKRNKESTKGIRGTILPIPTTVADKVIEYVVDKALTVVRKSGNLHVAIYRAIEAAKSHFGEAAKDLDFIHGEAFEESMSVYAKPPKTEPDIRGDFKEIANEWVEDMRSGELTYWEAVHEVLGGKGKDADKEAVLNYMQWKLAQDAPHHLPHKQPSASNKVGQHDFERYGVSNFLNKETTVDIFGEQGYFDEASEKKARLALEEMKYDVKGLVDAYREIDTAPSGWGRKMLSDIKEIPNQPRNQGAAASGLHVELQRQRVENERAMQDISRKLASNTLSSGERAQLADAFREINSEQVKLNRLIGDVQNFVKRLRSTASDVMNTGRLDRMMRDDLISEYYEKKILSEQEAEHKKEAERALAESVMKDYRNHPDYKADMQREAKKSQERARKEEKRDKEREKGKSVIKSIKDAVSRAGSRDKKKYETQRNKAQEQFPLNDKGVRMTPQEFVEHIKKLKKPC